MKRKFHVRCEVGEKMETVSKSYLSLSSSKTCSCCGAIKKDLKLSDRIYKCSCGLTIDRDLNASINLSRYKLA
nr:transposase [Clostridium botulinum]